MKLYLTLCAELSPTRTNLSLLIVTLKLLEENIDCTYMTGVGKDFFFLG